MTIDGVLVSHDALQDAGSLDTTPAYCRALSRLCADLPRQLSFCDFVCKLIVVDSPDTN